MTECCGTCKYHQHEDTDDGWVCVNDRMLGKDRHIKGKEKEDADSN